jgi:hypothetical protein
MTRLDSASIVLAASLAIASLSSAASAQSVAPVLKKGIVVQGGREAIGPKQDDPKAVGADACIGGSGSVQPGDGVTDPAGRKGIIVQGGREAIGPKQDDPRAGAIGNTGTRAIGPKQDDPRAAPVPAACRKTGA